jgi:ParB family chromosome partitioning protein
LRNDLGQLDELIASIEEKGLLEPIVVRPVEDGFEVVAGYRRLEACKRLGWRKIPCQIIELDDRESLNEQIDNLIKLEKKVGKH